MQSSTSNIQLRCTFLGRCGSDHPKKVKMISKLYTLKTKNTFPYKNLAVEEFLTHHVREGECVLFLWQNEKSVVVGKNQNIFAECDTSALKRDNVHPVRRLSGGGAVYHDAGNLNFTFCVRSGDYDVAKQSDVILKAVNSFGVNAIRTGRNDLTIEGKKFSGHAFYKSGDFCCHHGTILMNTDFSMMKKYLTPASDKLAVKGIKSVKSRVINLSVMIPGINRDMLCEKLVQSFSDVYRLPVNEMQESRLSGEQIKNIEKKYASRDFIFGKKAVFTHRIKRRYEWGGVEILLNVTDGVITGVRVMSDCMDACFPGLLEDRLMGSVYDEDKILSMIDDI